MSGTMQNTLAADRANTSRYANAADLGRILSRRIGLACGIEEGTGASASGVSATCTLLEAWS